MGNKRWYLYLKKRNYVSFITQLEVLGYKGITTIEQKKINQFLSECIIIDINPVIKNYTISLRQEYGLKLPDSIIMATSLYLNIPLITADKEYHALYARFLHTLIRQRQSEL